MGIDKVLKKSEDRSMGSRKKFITTHRPTRTPSGTQPGGFLSVGEILERKWLSMPQAKFQSLVLDYLEEILQKLKSKR